MKPADKNTSRFVAAALAVLVVVAAAFLAGRRTAGPGGAPAMSARAGHADMAHPDAHEGEEHGEHAGESGVIAFSEEAMKNARLTVQAVAVSSVHAPLPVTGEVEPNMSGVVKVSPRVAGKVTAVAVNVGDTVGPNAVLARVSSADLAAAQAAFRQSAARVQLARQNLTRQRRLAGLGEFGGHKVEEARRESAGARGEAGTARSEVDAALSGIAQARSEVRALEAAMEQAETGADVARSRAARAQSLYAEQLVSRQDLEQAQADARAAASGVAAARANVARGNAALEAARSQLGVAQAKLGAAQRRAAIASQATQREERIYRAGYANSKEIVEAEAAVRQAQLDQQAAAEQVRLLGGTPGGGETVAVTAPLGGRVTERAVTLGEMVSPEKALFTVVNLNTVWVQMRVYSRDVPLVRPGQRVTVSSDAAPGRAFAGSVSYVGDVVDETTRTVKVRAVIANAGGALKPGAFVRGTIATDGATQAIAVPRDAVQTLEGKTVVFVQGNHAGEFETREVQTGEASGGRVLIAKGLQAGDRIVTQGAFTVKAQAMKGELGEGHGH